MVVILFYFILQQKEFDQENDKLEVEKQGSGEHLRYKCNSCKFQMTVVSQTFFMLGSITEVTEVVGSKDLLSFHSRARVKMKVQYDVKVRHFNNLEANETLPAILINLMVLYRAVIKF